MEEIFFDEEIQMSKVQQEKQDKIIKIIEEIYKQKGFDLPYLYNGFDDNLYFIDRSPYIKVGLSLDEINKDSIQIIIDRLNKKL